MAQTQAGDVIISLVGVPTSEIIRIIGVVADYRQALSLGGVVMLPELYRAAGARFAFDARTLKAVVQLIEDTIEMLENTRDDRIS